MSPAFIFKNKDFYRIMHGWDIIQFTCKQVRINSTPLRDIIYFCLWLKHYSRGYTMSILIHIQYQNIFWAKTNKGILHFYNEVVLALENSSAEESHSGNKILYALDMLDIYTSFSFFDNYNWNIELFWSVLSATKIHRKFVKTLFFNYSFSKYIFFCFRRRCSFCSRRGPVMSVSIATINIFLTWLT